MDSSTILVKREGTTGIARIVGKGSFKIAPLLKDYAAQTPAYGIDRLVIDLQECPHVDSTFMGMLASIASDLKKRNCPAPRLINANPRNLELLTTLGLGHILEIDTASNACSPESFTPLQSAKEPSKTDVARTMLEAHEKLVELDPHNNGNFQDVISFLKNKLGPGTAE